jgi:hypothetical protein
VAVELYFIIVNNQATNQPWLGSKDRTTYGLLRFGDVHGLGRVLLWWYRWCGWRLN